MTQATQSGFVRRHIGPSPEDIQAMLAELGVSSLEELISQTVPAAIRQQQPLEIGPARSEADAIAKLRAGADIIHAHDAKSHTLAALFAV